MRKWWKFLLLGSAGHTEAEFKAVQEQLEYWKQAHRELQHDSVRVATGMLTLGQTLADTREQLLHASELLERRDQFMRDLLNQIQEYKGPISKAFKEEVMRKFLEEWSFVSEQEEKETTDGGTDTH